MILKMWVKVRENGWGKGFINMMRWRWTAEARILQLFTHYQQVFYNGFLAQMCKHLVFSGSSLEGELRS